MRILLTGAAGFIGAALAKRLLSEGHEIVGIDNLNDYYSVRLKRDRLDEVARAGGERFAFQQIDISDSVALVDALGGYDIDAIVHLAAQAGVRYSLQNPAAYVQSNLVGHLNILELARSRRVAHMVYASSSSVYGLSSQVPFTEDLRADRPVSLYAATKRADELMSESYAHLYKIPLTGLRFFTVYGPWGRPDMMPWIFTRKILAGEPIPVFNNGKLRRDFTFIDDIVAGIAACIGKPPNDDGLTKPGGSGAPHSVYNIGNSKAENLLDVIAVLESACGCRANIEMLPMQPGDVQETFADISAMQRDFGFQPTTSVETGMRSFVSWFRGYPPAMNILWQ